MPVSSWNDSFANPTFARSRNARMYISSRKGRRHRVALLIVAANATADSLSIAIADIAVTIAYCLLANDQAARVDSSRASHRRRRVGAADSRCDANNDHTDRSNARG